VITEPGSALAGSKTFRPEGERHGDVRGVEKRRRPYPIKEFTRTQRSYPALIQLA
jgi:hypothetical protein